MSKLLTVQLVVEDERLEEFIKNNGSLHDFFYMEVCQNWNFGFITSLTVMGIGEEK